MSGEYTPTTNEVRHAWWRDRCPPNDLDFDDIYNAAFDRWLAEHDADVWDEGHNHCSHVEDPSNRKRNPYRGSAGVS